MQEISLSKKAIEPPLVPSYCQLMQDRKEQNIPEVAARARQHTPEFQKLSHKRAGIEATMSQGVRAFGMRRSRYEGLAKTHLQHLACATAMNSVRVLAWLEEPSVAPTRISHFAALAV